MTDELIFFPSWNRLITSGRKRGLRAFGELFDHYSILLEHDELCEFHDPFEPNEQEYRRA